MSGLGGEEEESVRHMVCLGWTEVKLSPISKWSEILDF
jgi:hypothetical protein